MFKSSASKLLFFFLLVFAASCNVWRAGDTAAPSPTPPVPAKFKTEIPFSTREPEIYQAEMIVQSVGDGEKTERKIFTARNGARRLTIFGPGEKNEIALLEDGDGRLFSIFHGGKVYAENRQSEGLTGAASDDFFTAGWIDRKIPAAFESLETENNRSKYRVRLGETEPPNSEVLIYVDESLKLPVRQEIYSIAGGERSLTFSAEMKNFKLEAEEKFFQLPKDYRRVAPAEFQEFVRKERGLK